MASIANLPVINKTLDVVQPIYHKLDLLAPISNLAIRLWVAWVFFKAGLTKIGTWDSTLFLFEYEYSVPLLPPDFAAMLATSIELAIPVFLVLGLAGRMSVLILFLFNIMAVLSYPELNAAGLRDHQVWGIMLLVPLLQGPGKLSVDYLLSSYWNKKDQTH